MKRTGAHHGMNVEMNVKLDLTASEKPGEITMRMMAVVVATIAAMTAASPARTQTYDPSYPVCLQTYGIDGGYISCGYMSMEQCRLSASGRAAQCIVNPYFAVAPGRSRNWRQER